MGEYPQTANELVNQLEQVDIEYVYDIVVNDEKRYGLSVTGKFVDEDEEINVHGSVVLDEESGEPINCEGTKFVIYLDGMMNDPVILAMGKVAVDATGRLYVRTQSDTNPFKPRSEAQISNDAM